MPVEKASMKSPLPWRAVEPVRASPNAARFPRRVSCRPSNGASVAMTTMIDPSALPLVPSLTGGVTAFLCALIVIPVSIKLMQWIDGAGIGEIIRHLRGRG